MKKNKMKHNKPQYPILQPEDMLPREQLRLNPKKELSPLGYAELCNLRRGVSYKLIVTDSPENRNTINLKTAYFQMVACKEGWEFKPESYQVKYVLPRALEGIRYSRILRLKDGAEPSFKNSISRENRIGYSSVDEEGTVFRRMEHDAADGLAQRVLRLFFDWI